MQLKPNATQIMHYHTDVIQPYLSYRDWYVFSAVLAILYQVNNAGKISGADLSDRLNMDRSGCYSSLKSLVNLGLLVVVDPQKGSRAATYAVQFDSEKISASLIEKFQRKGPNKLNFGGLRLNKTDTIVSGLNGHKILCMDKTDTIASGLNGHEDDLCTDNSDTTSGCVRIKSELINNNIFNNYILGGEKVAGLACDDFGDLTNDPMVALVCSMASSAVLHVLYPDKNPKHTVHKRMMQYHIAPALVYVAGQHQIHDKLSKQEVFDIACRVADDATVLLQAADVFISTAAENKQLIQLPFTTGKSYKKLPVELAEKWFPALENWGNTLEWDFDLFGQAVKTAVRKADQVFGKNNQCKNPSSYADFMQMAITATRQKVRSDAETEAILAAQRERFAAQDLADEHMIDFEPDFSSEDDLSARWDDILQELKITLSANVFRQWVKPTHPIELSDGCLLVKCHNDQAQEWLEKRLNIQIEPVVCALWPDVKTVRYTADVEVPA